MVTLENGNYVVELPEYGVKQPINPDVQPQRPFASQTEAQAWETAFLAGLAAAQTAAQSAAAAALAAKLSAEVHLSVTATPAEAAVGASISFAATLKDGHGNVLPINQTFAVPIQDATGAVVRVKSIPLVNGAATVSLSFAASGYYRITEAEINKRLAGMYIHLDTPIEVTVVE